MSRCARVCVCVRRVGTCARPCSYVCRQARVCVCVSRPVERNFLTGLSVAFGAGESFAKVGGPPRQFPDMGG